jgi:hypothetical protein
MAALSELFASDHARALAHATALDGGSDPQDAPRLELTSITPLDLEVLGEIAADVVHFGTGDLECQEVDLDYDNLVELPPFLLEVLLELATHEDPDAISEVAERWAASEELATTPENALSVLTDVLALVRVADREDLSVYLWVEQES